MKKYLSQLKTDLHPALQEMPSPETFGALYDYGFEEGDLSNVTIKTLGKWLGIDMETLPPADKLSERQQRQMAHTLLSYWAPDDELVLVIRHAQPKRQYESAIEFLSIKGRYDGYGGFKLENPSISLEDYKNIRSPLDMLDEWDDSDTPLTDNKESEQNLPF